MNADNIIERIADRTRNENGDIHYPCFASLLQGQIKWIAQEYNKLEVELNSLKKQIQQEKQDYQAITRKESLP